MIPRHTTGCGYRWIAALLLALPATAPATARADDSGALLERLEQHVGGLEDLEPRAQKLILETLEARDADSDPELLLIESLVLISEPFRTALDAYDEEQYGDCLEALADIDPADESVDPFVRYNAATYRVRALVHMDRLTEALKRMETLDGEAVRTYTLDASAIAYLRGYCLIQTLEYDRGREALERFLEQYPDAPRRYTMTARQMLAELDRRIPESMGEISDLMTFSHRRLAAADTTDRVVTAQQRIIELLDKLADEAEKQEQQAQQSQSQSQQQRQRQRQQQRQQNQQQQSPSQPKTDSAVEPGHAEDSRLRPERKVSPGEAWGAMPDAQREQVLQMLRDSFPGRYRALVEQYYQNLSEEP